MATFRKYSFRKYSRDFPRFFSLEKYRLRKVFPDAIIEHVGSSSVKGLGGKGIIDILVAVPKKEITKSISKLENIGYEHIPFRRDINRKFFQRIIRYSGRERRVHIHLTYKNGSSHNSLVAVRDHLRKNSIVAREYSEIKKQAVKFAKGEGKLYKEYKKTFLDKLERKAVKEYLK